jgi:hypothetical protein
MFACFSPPPIFEFELARRSVILGVVDIDLFKLQFFGFVYILIVP